MFEEVTKRYDGSDASFEIIIMLLVAFILGYLLRYVLGSSRRKRKKKEIDHLTSRTIKLQNEIDRLNKGV